MRSAQMAPPMPRPDRLPIPTRPLRPAAPVRPVDILAAVRGGGGYAAWALRVGSGEVASCWLLGGIEVAERKILELLGSCTDASDMRVALHCQSARVVAAAGAMAQVDAYPVQVARLDPAMHSVTSAAGEVWEQALSGAPRLEVAVDGSWGRGTKYGGWAFLASDGSHGSNSAGLVSSTGEAELRAILLALQSIPESRALAIRTDSRQAERLLREPGSVKHGLAPLVARVCALLAERDVQVSWVKGHQEPGLHDGADRLAVAARRAREAGLGACAPQAVAARIVAESTAAHFGRNPQDRATLAMAA